MKKILKNDYILFDYFGKKVVSKVIDHIEFFDRIQIINVNSDRNYFIEPADIIKNYGGDIETIKNDYPELII